MKSCVSLVVMLLIAAPAISVAEAVQPDAEPIHYAVTGLVRFFEYDPMTGATFTKIKVPQRGIKFEIVGKVSLDGTGKHVDPDKGTLHYVVEVYDITVKGDPLKGSVIAVNSADNDKHFVMTKASFDEAVADNYIQKRALVTAIPSFAYGATLAVPFKLRPRGDGDKREITSELTLGGYAGVRWRTSTTKRHYVNLIASAGLTLLPMNDSVVEGDMNVSSTVPGFTIAGGVVLELEAFQLGFMTGRDYASGDLGSTWVYNGKQWVSLSIGFTFLKPD